MMYNGSYFHPSNHSICVRATGGHCFEPSPSLGRHSSQEVLFTQKSSVLPLSSSPSFSFTWRRPPSPFLGAERWFPPGGRGDRRVVWGRSPRSSCSQGLRPFLQPTLHNSLRTSNPAGVGPVVPPPGREGEREGEGEGEREGEGEGSPMASPFFPTELSALYGTALYVLGGLLSRGKARSVTG